MVVLFIVMLCFAIQRIHPNSLHCYHIMLVCERERAREQCMVFSVETEHLSISSFFLRLAFSQAEHTQPHCCWRKKCHIVLQCYWNSITSCILGVQQYYFKTWGKNSVKRNSQVSSWYLQIWDPQIVESSGSEPPDLGLPQTLWTWLELFSVWSGGCSEGQRGQVLQISVSMGYMNGTTAVNEGQE